MSRSSGQHCVFGRSTFRYMAWRTVIKTEDFSYFSPVSFCQKNGGIKVNDLSVISGFRRGVDENFALLRCQTLWICSHLPTFRDNLLVPLKVGLIGQLETSVNSQQSSRVTSQKSEDLSSTHPYKFTIYDGDCGRVDLQTSDSQPGFRGALGYREHFLGVPRDVEITNVLQCKYSEENNMLLFHVSL